MATGFKYFATPKDMEIIIDWLRAAGGTRLHGEPLKFDDLADGSLRVVHFPACGPLNFWPPKIELPEVGDNSPRAKRAILAMEKQIANPDISQIDVDHSAVAGLRLPELVNGQYWVAAEAWFPTCRLRQVFPELGKICGKLERFLAKHPTVFDNRKASEESLFPRQLCTGGVIQKITALPEAFELLNGGAYMIDSDASEFVCRQFLYDLSLQSDK